MFDFTYQKTIDTVENQLKLYKTDYIDLIQIHDPEFITIKDQATGKYISDPEYKILIDECLPALKELKKQGKIRYIGVNGYPFEIYEQIVNNSPVKIDTIFTYGQLTMLSANFIEFYKELSSRNENFKDSKIGVLNASPTALGLLTPQGPQPWHPAPSNIKDLVKKAIEIAEKYRINITTLALKFDQIDMAPYKTTTLIGCCKVAEAEHNFVESNKTEFGRYIGDEKICLDEIQGLFRKSGLKLSWEGREVAQHVAAMNEVQK